VRLVLTPETNASQRVMHRASSDGVWRTTSLVAPYLYGQPNALDDAATRLFMHDTVYDDSFTPVGKIWRPEPGWFERTATLSPDGRRLYVLVYREDSPTGGVPVNPRVHVYDTRVPAGAAADLPVLGAFDVPDFPTCFPAPTYPDDFSCVHPVMLVAPDGRTLFIAGASKLVVLPVPALAAPLAARPGASAMRAWTTAGDR